MTRLRINKNGTYRANYSFAFFLYYFILVMLKNYITQNLQYIVSYNIHTLET